MMLVLIVLCLRLVPVDGHGIEATLMAKIVRFRYIATTITIATHLARLASNPELTLILGGHTALISLLLKLSGDVAIIFPQIHVIGLLLMVLICLRKVVKGRSLLAIEGRFYLFLYFHRFNYLVVHNLL